MIKNIPLVVSIACASLLPASLMAKPAKQPVSPIPELAGALQQIALFNSQYLQSQKSTWLHENASQNPWIQRLKAHQKALDQVHSGNPDEPIPGSITSWLISFPYDSPSLSDFERRFTPETQGFNTTKPSEGSKFQELPWVRYDATGNASQIKPLDAMASQGFSAFYLATRIQVDAKKGIDADIEVPSATAVIGWMNGQKFLHDVRSDLPMTSLFASRQTVHLNPGENILVLKVAAMESEPGFYVFLSDPKTGAPIQLTSSADGQIISSALESNTPDPGKPSVYEEIFNDDQQSPAIRALASRNFMPEVASNSAVHNLLLSDLDSTANLSTSELEIAVLALNPPGKSLPLLKKALELRPDDVQLQWIYARQILRAANEQGDSGSRFANEWPEIKQSLGNAAPSVDGRSYETLRQSLLLHASLMAHLPLTGYRNLPDSCKDDCRILMLQSLASSLNYSGNTEEYLKILDELSTHRKDLADILIERIQTRLFLDLENVASGVCPQIFMDAQTEIQNYLQIHPYDDVVWKFWLHFVSTYGPDSDTISDDMKQACLDAGFNATADEQYLQYLSMRVNDADRWLAYADFSLNRKNTEEAVSAYEMASKLRPQDESIQERANILQLSEDPDNAIVSSFEKKYIIHDIPANTDPNASGVVSLLNNRVVRILPDGLTSTFTQLVFEVIDDQGVKLARENGLNYMPTDEKVEILGVTVTKKDGSVRKLYKSKEFSLGEDAYKLFYDQRYIQITVPDVGVGDRVEFQFKRTTLQKSASSVLHFSDLFQLQGRYAQQWDRYTVIAPDSLHIHFTLHKPDLTVQDAPVTVTKDGDNTVTTFEQNNSPRFLSEQNMPGPSEVVPILLVSSFGSWQELLNWNLDLVRSQWEINDDIRAEVKRLTEDTDDRLERLKRIHSFVVKTTRYVGLEYGIHSFKPYPVSQIFERRFGDCKDKASLLKVMLDEAGIPTNYTLIRTIDNGDINPALAMPFYFNHAIVYVPEFDLFLDGTAEFSGIHELPKMDQGGFAFITQNDGTYKLAHAPVSKPEENIFDESITFDLTGDQVNYSVTQNIHGADAPSYRYRYQVIQLQRENFEKYLSSRIAGTKVNEVTLSDLSDLNADVHATATATTSRTDLVKSSDNTWLIYPLGSMNHILSSLAPLPSRHTPSMSALPLTQKKSVTYILPDSAQFTVPQPVSQTSPFGSYSIQTEFADHKLTTTVNIQLTQFRILPDDYIAYLDFLQGLEQKLNTMYKIELKTP